MKLYAKDLMITTFHTINENASAEEAIRMIFSGKIRETGHKTVSLMVVDDCNTLTGLISMFGLLYHLRPSFLNHGIDGQDVVWQDELETYIDALRVKKVREVMAPVADSVAPDEPLMSVLDRIIKTNKRRMPVIDNNRLVGVVYISDIYYHLFHAYNR